MKKNALLTFIFACIPGAGQMYYGYMKRGLSMITLFCVSLTLGSIISVLIVAAPIIWMYSFFDTYDLIRNLVAGNPKPDALLLGNIEDIQKMIPRHNRLIGWAVILFGLWILYENLIVPTLTAVFNALGLGDWWSWVDYSLPSLVVAVLLILLGGRLLGIHPRHRNHPNSDLPPYPGEHGDHGMGGTV